MTELLLLAGWSGAGVASTAVFRGTPDSRWAWAPMAAILGPLWPAVAYEQRAAAALRNDMASVARHSDAQQVLHDLRDAVSSTAEAERVAERPEIMV